jgi:chemotaxis protein MotB
MAQKTKCEDCPALPAWITTYGDMMSLLLTFFILLLSFSTIEIAKFTTAAGSFQGYLGVLDGEPRLVSPIQMYVPFSRGEELDALHTLRQAMVEIEEDIEAAGEQEDIEVVKGTEGMVIRIRDQAVFGSGEADIKPALRPLLLQIGAALAHIPNQIEIEGHTDNIPISSGRFPSNHWLSTTRAMRVLDLFAAESGIDGARLSATGFGEHRPLVANDTPEGRAKNRRVEIKVRYDKGDQTAPPAEVQQLLQQNGLRNQGSTRR